MDEWARALELADELRREVAALVAADVVLPPELVRKFADAEGELAASLRALKRAQAIENHPAR
jgi:hypothetical protein